MKELAPTCLGGRADGFTVIETLAALAIFGIVAAGLAANSVAAARYNRISRNLSVATALAQDQLEQLRALDPSTNPAALTGGVHSDPNNPIAATGGRGGPFTREWTVTRDVPARGVSIVIVAVSWSDGATRTVRMVAYVCQTLTCS